MVSTLFRDSQILRSTLIVLGMLSPLDVIISGIARGVHVGSSALGPEYVKQS